jgi:hypothetical protein
LRRRTRIIAKLEEEKAVAADPNYKWTVRRRAVEMVRRNSSKSRKKFKRGGVPLATKMYALGIRLGL